jgi:hypothetical protein
MMVLSNVLKGMAVLDDIRGGQAFTSGALFYHDAQALRKANMRPTRTLLCL